MERQRDEALLLSAVDHGESDRVVTFLTRHHGRLSAFAAGARRSKRRFGGTLEPFMHLNILWVQGRGELVRLEATDLLEGFYGMRADLPRIARALYCVELLRELTVDAQPHPELLDAALTWLRAQEAGKAGPTSLIALELYFLGEAGLTPRFDACVLCDAPLDGPAAFASRHGGVVCAGCRLRAPDAVALTAALREALLRIQQGERLPLDAAMRAQARAVLNGYLEHHLGRRLKSADFMAQIGMD